jgi:integrase
LRHGQGRRAAGSIEPARHAHLGPHEVKVFLRHVKDERLAAMWRLFIATGMRRGEIVGLRWIDVDLEAARLEVRHTGTTTRDQERGFKADDANIAVQCRRQSRHVVNV